MPPVRGQERRRSVSVADEPPPTRELRRSKKVNYTVDSDDDDDQKPVTRPSRIISTNRIKRTDHNHYNANASSSRLLKLPAELRERIFTLVLGGKTIHTYIETPAENKRAREDFFDDGLYVPGDGEYQKLSTATSPEDDFNNLSDDSNNNRDRMKAAAQKKNNQLCLRHSVCARTITEYESIEHVAAEDASVRSRGHTTWPKRHRYCRCDFYKSMRPLKRLDLALLSVCRQVHGEAAVLPFQENTFSFQNFGTMAVFLNKLIPSQLRAIQHVEMPYACHQSNATRPSIETKIKTSFRSLKFLTILLESHDDWYFNWKRVKVLADLMQLKKLDLESVVVQCRVVDKCFIPEGLITLERFEGYGKDIEETMKQDWNTKDKAHLEELRKEVRKKFGLFDAWT